MSLIKTLLVVCATAMVVLPAAHAAGGKAKSLEKPASEPLPDWSFKGPFGRFDDASVQRGWQVYLEVCSACHGLELMSYRNLAEAGGPFYDYENPDDALALVKAFAAQYTANDLDEIGEVIQRPALLTDPIASPYPNSQAARAANGGALPPDMSVISKARVGGPDYIYRLLTGYPDAEEIVDEQLVMHGDEAYGEEVHGVLAQPVGLYYNPYYAGDTLGNWTGDPRHAPPGGFLAMPPQLTDGRVTYLDGTEATKEQMAEDVAHFLAWASEPKSNNRKSLGFAVMVYLSFLALLLYFSYRQIWRNVEH